MRLRDETVKFQLDCGATVNILPADIYQQVFNDPRMERLQPTQTTLVMFNKSELKPLMRLSPKATPISATANSGNEIPSVPPSIPSTAVSKDQSDTVPLQNTDKPHPEYPPQSAADKQEISPSVTTTRSGRIVRPPTRYQ